MVTIKEIKEIGQWGAPEHMLEEAKTYPYVAYVLRKISPYFTKFFIEHNISANQTSLLSIIFGIIANFTFIFGSYYSILVGCLLYQFWSIFDLSDGEIARVTNVKTAGGKYLETINVVITECAFTACLGIGLSKILNNNTFILLGLIFALFICLLNNFARTRDLMKEKFEVQNTKITTEKISYVKRLYKKARLFFVIVNAYIILTIIVLIELFFPIKLYYAIFGNLQNILSTYFLMYGFIWMIRTIISSTTNYIRLMRS